MQHAMKETHPVLSLVTLGFYSFFLCYFINLTLKVMLAESYMGKNNAVE